MTGASAPAFDYSFSALDQFLIQRPLSSPTASEIAQCVTSRREGPLRKSGLFNPHGLLFTIFNICGTSQNAALLIHGVAQGHINFAGNVLQHNVSGIGIVRRYAYKT